LKDFASFCNNIGEYETASTLAEKAIKIDPDYSKAYLVYGISLQHLRKYEEAIYCFEKCIEIDPEDNLASKLKN